VEGREMTFFSFDFPDGSDNLNWFTKAPGLTSPYLDLPNSAKTISIPGAVNPGMSLNWRFLMQKNFPPTCRDDQLWFVVMEDLLNDCSWARSKGGSDLPKFLFAPAVDGRAAAGPDMIAADTMIITVNMQANAFGGNCKLTCANTPNGKYHSCIGCDVYVECNNNILRYFQCPDGMEFNSALDECVSGSSATCRNGKKALPQCRPGGAVTQAPVPVATEPPRAGDEYHVVFRVASGYITAAQAAGQEVLGSSAFWLSGQTNPTLNYPITEAAFSNSPLEKLHFKSVLVECAWDRILTARVGYYKNNVEQAFIEFVTGGLSKTQWFARPFVYDSTYDDLKESNPVMFSINGFTFNQNGININRRFYIQKNDLTSCAKDILWSSVTEAPRSFCGWENDNSPSIPRIFYSGTGSATKGSDLEEADVLKVSVRLEDDAFGGNCVSSCVGMPDGRHQSCIGCNVFILCNANEGKLYSCKPSTVFDDTQKRCVRESTTCFDRLAYDFCVPQQEQACRCFIFGDPVAELCDGSMFYFSEESWHTTVDTRPYNPDCQFKAEVKVCKPNNLLICLYRVTVWNDVIRIDKNAYITVNEDPIDNYPLYFDWGSIEEINDTINIYLNCGLAVKARKAETGVIQEIYNPGYIFEGLCKGEKAF
jgi:hypothetical protein